MTDWLSVPEFADRLGVKASHVRELIRERHLVATRRGENDSVALPSDFLVEGDRGVEVLPTLRGTITVLADGGFSDEEILDWLLSESEELSQSPIAALRDGKRAPVRRAAQALL